MYIYLCVCKYIYIYIYIHTYTHVYPQKNPWRNSARLASEKSRAFLLTSKPQKSSRAAAACGSLVGFSWDSTITYIVYIDINEHKYTYV